MGWSYIMFGQSVIQMYMICSRARGLSPGHGPIISNKKNFSGIVKYINIICVEFLQVCYGPPQVAGGRCQVAGGRCQVLGGRCQVAGGRCQVLGVQCYSVFTALFKLMHYIAITKTLRDITKTLQGRCMQRPYCLQRPYCVRGI